MALGNRRGKVRIDRDGVKHIDTSGVRPGVWIAAAVLIALAVGFFLMRSVRTTDEGVIAASTASQQPANQPPPRAQPPKYKPIPRAEPAEVPVRENPVPAKPGSEADPEPPVEAGQDDSEAPTGIALFPPPGTDPIKRGLIVPEAFELPPGYVRHYQATDDGRQLPAILMFHPDYDWVDEQGNRIEIPDDHIVPPELAPAGLPLETLDVSQPEIPMIEEPGDGETTE